MYNVSELYKQKVIEPARTCKVEGTLLTSTGVSIPISDDNISAGSLSVDTKCVSGEDISLGSVYTAELNFSINSEIDRYSLFGGIVTLSWFLKINETDYEEVPLGKFNIYTAERTGKFINIKAYDNMINLDASLGQVISGTIYEIMNFISINTGVNLAQSETELNSLAPSDFIFGYKNLNNLTTYRDLLSNLALVLGGFAIIDRFGMIKIIKFGKTVVRTLDDNYYGRKSGKFSDFTNRFSKVVVNVNGKVFSAGNDIFMTMILPKIYVCDNRNDAEINTLVDNILASIPNEEGITPFSAGYISDPSFDVGDLIKNVGYGLPTSGLNSLITNFKFGHKNQNTISCVGKNPKLAETKTAINKAIEQATNEAVEKSENAVLAYTNAQKYLIGNTFKNIATMKFAVLKESVPIFNAQILLDVETEGLFEVNYQLNGDILLFKPMQNYFASGKYIMNLFLPLTSLAENSGNTLKVLIKSDSGSGAIEIGNLVATINASGLSTKLKWDGTLEFTENIEYVNISTFSMKDVSGVVSMRTQKEDIKGFTESIGYLNVGGMNIIGISDDIIVVTSEYDTTAYDYYAGDELIADNDIII